MYQKTSIYKRISLVLGITTLLLGLIPVPVLGRVGMVSADDGVVTEPPPEEVLSQPTEEPTVEPAVDPVSEPTPEPTLEPSSEPNSEPAPELAAEPTPELTGEAVPPQPEVTVPASEELAGEVVLPGEEVPPSEEVPTEEPIVEEPLLLGFAAPSLFLLSSAIGDDPNIANELPDFGNTYSNGDCVTNTSCETAEPVTNPNDYTDQGTYGEKDYALPDFGGNTANIVGIKQGDEWFFFKVGSGATCDNTTFCVEFDGSGNVKVFSYVPQANGYSGYNMIHFWFVAPDEEGTPGCTDQSATNYNPDATKDDGSCEYEESVPGCMDETATNYNPDATEDNGSCEFEEEQIPGCTDRSATNYNPDATEDDGSCEYEEQSLDLTLNAVCTPGEGGYHLAWYINNPNDFDVSASWELNGVPGDGTMSPGSNFIGNTPNGSASYTLNASWKFGEASKTAQALCKPEKENQPETVTFTAPQAPLIIPVTGVDLDGGFALYRKLMLMAGSVLLGSGLMMKRAVKKEKKQKK